MNSKNIINHRRYEKNDYERLKVKGYNDEEIEKIWDDDTQRQLVNDLLWLKANKPERAEQVIAEYDKHKEQNPHAQN